MFFFASRRGDTIPAEPLPKGWKKAILPIQIEPVHSPDFTSNMLVEVSQLMLPLDVEVLTSSYRTGNINIVSEHLKASGFIADWR